MEVPIPARRKPLSYDALKSVIKSMSVEKRQELHTDFPSLRAVNSVLPYTIKEVRIMPNSLRINRKLWVINKNRERSNSDDEDSNETTISIVDLDTNKRTPYFTVNKFLDEAFEKCFNAYLKNGSTIQEFDLYNFPNFLCERDGSVGLKLNISKLRMEGEIVDKFDSFIRFVNLDNLEHIHLILDDRLNEHGEWFGMLEKPLITNCKNLDLSVHSPVSLINYYTGLRNQTLVLYYHNIRNFPANDLHILIENWKTTNRPIGTSFYLYSLYNDTINIFNSLEFEDTFPVEVRGDTTDKPGIGIHLDDYRDLILCHGRHLIGSCSFPSLKMEVIASGLQRKNGDSEPDVSA
ncbi:hypothetical protein GCK72_007913 [Caenorhabditis remanei]|uniref:F-box associated domain-containing protein n=1 Tax=Caenorhabditis remanei TaxID=31234 RepID=A0A6A5HNN1_CAERE|nr:hypothetical protein GCK72_007913 [Caenorhabditis remanei]KAF1767953.1 hypothetical protein GCK72_007913 [Caenorhabditis remanei]